MQLQRVNVPSLKNTLKTKLTHIWMESRVLMCQISVSYLNILIYESEIIRSRLLII